jgi:hypothetical protein
MSLVATRANLTHRCTIERDQNAGTLDEGAVQAADWQAHLTDLRCRAWMSTGDEQIADGTTIVQAASVRVIVPAGTDVTDADRVASVTYRGETYVAGPLGVRAVLRRKDHTELVCQRVG